MFNIFVCYQSKYIRTGSDLLFNISLSVSQSFIDKSLLLCARDLSTFNN